MTPPRIRPRGEAAFNGQQPGAVRKALGMLEAVARLGPGTTAQEIARATSVPPATTYRLLNLLVADGYLVRVPDLSGFALGHRIAELAGAVDTGETGPSLHQVAADLRQRTRFGLHVASFAKARLSMVDPDPDHELDDAELLGRTPHANALGKVMLAHHPDFRPDQPLRRLTEHTIVDQARLTAELHQVLTSGYAFESEETCLGRAAVAVPIRDASLFVVGALYLLGPASRVTPHDDGLIDFLRTAATRLSGTL